MKRNLFLFASFTWLFSLNAQIVEFEPVLPPSENRNISFMGMAVGDLAIADIDNDNDLDIIIIGENGNGHYVTNLYKNDGDGNFTIVNNTPFDGARTGSVEWADIDNDNDMDVLIAGQHSDYSIYTKLYKNDGAGNFSLVENTPFEAIIQGVIKFADVDGDSDLDVFIAGNNISKLYLNDGQGNFTESSNVFAEVRNCSADIADVNGDAYVDIVLSGVNGENQKITKLYINDGLGNYSEDIPSASIFDQVGYSCVALGDADGDMDNDLIFTGINNLEQRVTRLYLNDGGGNFTLDKNNSFINISLGTVFFADLDNDGDNDIYLAGTHNSIGGKVATIYENNGGVFTQLATSPFDLVTTGSAKARDLDGDNYLDIITIGSTNRIANSEYVNEFRASNVFLNQGDMSFRRVRGCSISGFENSTFDYADIDLDNDLDLIIAGESENGLTSIVYKNDGVGNFSEHANFLIPGSFYDGTVELADVNGDAYPDLLITGINNDEELLTQLYLNDGNGDFEIVGDTPFVGVESGTSLFFDIDNDGDLDLLLTGETDAHASDVRLYVNDGMGNFTEDSSITFDGVRDGSVAVSDIDGDNDLDVLIAGSKCVRMSEYDMTCQFSINLYTNDGDGHFSKSAHNPFPAVSSCAISFADVDNDGDPDVLITGSGTGFRKFATVFKNDGAGFFTEDTKIPIPGVSKSSVAFGHVNGDAYVDLIISGYTIDKKELTSLYVNDGSGHFSKEESVVMDGLSWGCIAFIDIDNDGDDDVLTSGSGFSKLYRNITGEGITTDVEDVPDQWVNKGEMTLHPNPTRGNVTIKLNSHEITNIQVFNSLGMKCFEDKNVNAMEYDLKIEEPQGLYYVKVSTKQFGKMIKVIKR